MLKNYSSLLLSCTLLILPTYTAAEGTKEATICNSDPTGELFIEYDSRYGATDTYTSLFEWRWRSRTQTIEHGGCWSVSDISLEETKGASPAAIKNIKITYSNDAITSYNDRVTFSNETFFFEEFYEKTTLFAWGTFLNDDQANVEPYLNSPGFNFRYKQYINGEFSDANYRYPTPIIKGADQEPPLNRYGYERNYIAAFTWGDKSYAFSADGYYSRWDYVKHPIDFDKIESPTRHSGNSYSELAGSKYPARTSVGWDLEQEEIAQLSAAVERDDIAYFFFTDGTFTTYNLRSNSRISEHTIRGGGQGFYGLKAAGEDDYVRAAVRDTESGDIYLFYSDKYSVWSTDGSVTETDTFTDGNWRGLGFRKKSDGTFAYDPNGILFKGADITAMLEIGRGDAITFIKHKDTGEPKWLAVDVPNRKTVGAHSRNDGYNIHHTYLRGIDYLQPLHSNFAMFDGLYESAETSPPIIFTEAEEVTLPDQSGTPLILEPLRIGGTKRCVGVAGANRSNGTNIVLWDCDNHANQNWAYTSSGALVSEHSGKCLDVSLTENVLTSPNHNGRNVQLWDCHGGQNQSWTIHSNETITSDYNGLCLDLSGYNNSNGANIQMWSCTGNWNQKFGLKKAK